MKTVLPQLYPPPCRYETSGGLFVLPTHARVILAGPSSEFSPHLRLLEDVLPLEVSRQIQTTPDGQNYRLQLLPLETLSTANLKLPFADEVDAYGMEIREDSIEAYATTCEGLYRACATLRQLLKSEIPCGEITDAPTLSVRGLMLDVSRGRTYSLPTLFWIIDRMAEIKMNRLELYFEAIFAYSKHSSVWGNSSPYTAADVQILARYCHDRFITLIPNQNTLGHFERWFRHKDYLQYAEMPQGGAITPWGSVQEEPTGLCTTSEPTVEFVAGLLNELLPNFPEATEANLGGDEVFDLGLGRSQGKGERGALYLSYLVRIASVARKQGKTPTFWADMLLRHPEIIARAKEMLPDARWIVWGYEATDPLIENAQRLIHAGLEILVAPGTSSWRSFCGRTTNTLENIRCAVTAACLSPRQKRGLLLTDWGDAGHWQPLVIMLPALVWAASLAWNANDDLNLAFALDDLTQVPNLGAFLLKLGDTYRFTGVETGNATQLFKQFLLPLDAPSPFTRTALESVLEQLRELETEAARLGTALFAEEARWSLALQKLAVERALGVKNLTRDRARLVAQLQLLWLRRGPRAELSSALARLNAVILP
ncbi:MAG: family 20 glycosylhydrolase [Kiritimatiellia bacterium]